MNTKNLNFDAIISEWTISPCNPGRHGIVSLRGRIYNDQKGRFLDGEMVITSEIKHIDFEQGLVHTNNSIYKLDDI